MALLRTHILVSALAIHRSKNRKDLSFKDMLPFFVLPDALRCFDYGIKENNRVITHFEINPNNHDISWIVFPDKEALKCLDEKNVKNLSFHVAPDYFQVKFGDTTSIGTFKKHNSALPEMYYKGVLMHLVEDCIYDNFIKKRIDMSMSKISGTFILKSRYNDIYFDKNNIRGAVNDMESQGFSLLSKKYEKEMGVYPSIDWFNENVKPVLQEAYSEKMARVTWEYILSSLQEKHYHEYVTNSEVNDCVEKMIRGAMQVIV